MRWKWGLAIVAWVGAACASLDGLTGGEKKSEPPDGGPFEAEAPVQVEASSPVDAGEAADVLYTDAAPLPTWCTELDASLVMFCADFDNGSLAWTTPLVESGTVMLTDASTSPPFGALVKHVNGTQTLTGLRQEVPARTSGPGSLQFEFDAFIADGAASESVLAAVGMHSHSIFLELTGSDQVVGFEQIVLGDGGVSSRPITSLAVTPGWSHFRLTLEPFLQATPPFTIVRVDLNASEGIPQQIDGGIGASSTNLFVQVSASGPVGVVYDNVILSAQ